MSGVLFETGCGKYIKMVNGVASFYSSKEDGSVIDKKQFDDLSVRMTILNDHKLARYVDTIVFHQLKP